MRLLIGLAILLLCPAAYAATGATITCAPPTTRVNGAALALTEIKSYQFYFRGVKAVKPSCSNFYPLAYGECFPVGSVFAASVTDMQGLESAQGKLVLQSPICRGYPKCRWSYNGYGIKVKWPAGCIP